MEHIDSESNKGNLSVAEESVDDLIARAKAEGYPWADAAGIFPDDELTQAWIEEMQAARRHADENPDF